MHEESVARAMRNIAEYLPGDDSAIRSTGT
jgi:hypothetical protein